MEKELIGLGLSKQEAEIYLNLLSRGSSIANTIAKETKINRSVTYSILDSLLEKGLVTYVIKNGVKNFSASSLGSLSEFIEQKKRILKDLIPKIKSIKIQNSNRSNVEVFQGISGGIAVLKDILTTGKDYFAFGEDLGFQNLGTIAEQYIRRLNESKIVERFLVPEGQKVIKSKNSVVRYLPSSIKLPAITTIYGNKTSPML
jgi:predicted transcriptional regulator